MTSPRPWKADSDRVTVRDGWNFHVFMYNDDYEDAAENAALIVHCVNLHDELVARLEAMCDLAELQGGFDDEDGMRSIARSRKTLEKARKADAD